MATNSITQKDKIAGYDSLKARCDKYELAAHDLVNGKFSAQCRVNLKDFDPDWVGGFYGMRLSLRAMPLFLVRYVVSTQDDQVEIFTDSEIRDGYTQHPTSVYWRMLMHGRNELMAKYLPIQKQADAVRESMTAEVS